MAPRPICHRDLVFRDAGVDTPVRCKVELLTPEGTTPARARVSFDGSSLPEVEFEASDDLAAVTGALHAGTTELRGLSSGLEVFHEVERFGLEKTETDLFEAFRSLLEHHLGLPERPYLGSIVEGPTPTEWGEVEFRIRHEENEVCIFVDASSIGCLLDVDLELANIGMRLADRYVRENDAEMRELYRKAAAMRRAAGNPASPDATKGNPDLVERYEVRRELVVFSFHPPNADATVFLSPNGACGDDWKNWDVDVERREEVLASALAFAISRPEEMRAAGLDTTLLEEFYL